MRFSTTQALLLGGGGGVAAMPAPGESWALTSLVRLPVGQTHCEWAFSIDGVDTCRFQVHDAVSCVRADVTTPILCAGGNFKVALQHDQTASVTTLYLERTSDQAHASFVLPEVQLASQVGWETTPVAVQPGTGTGIGTGTGTGGAAVVMRAPSGPTAQWTLRNLTRTITADHPDTVDLSFDLTSAASNNSTMTTLLSRCHLHLRTPDGATASRWSFYQERCDGDGYFVSWGYAPYDDGAVVTLIDPKAISVAWFGVPHVNNRTALGDFGPGSMSTAY